jgi:hypothetical protein
MIHTDTDIAKEEAERFRREARRCFALAAEARHDAQLAIWLEALGRLMARRAGAIGKATVH